MDPPRRGHGAPASRDRDRGGDPAAGRGAAAPGPPPPPPRPPRRADPGAPGGAWGAMFNSPPPAAILAASCGGAVAKHGNRAVTSRTGSADVLETLGVRIDLTPESAGRSLDHLGITFLFAPNYHSAMRNAAGARKEMGVRTVVNLLGPITN